MSNGTYNCCTKESGLAVKMRRLVVELLLALGATVVAADVLVAGGLFEGAGGGPARSVAQWDGTPWAPIGAGLGPYDSTVLALVVFNGALHAGGNFSGYVARWDGQVWTTVGREANDLIRELHVHKGQLVASGWFTSIGGVSARRIAQWDGADWWPLGAGLGGGAFSMITFRDNLIVGGDFADPFSEIAQWDGAVWSPLGTGVFAGIRAMIEYRGNLVVGGFVNMAGSIPVNRTAMWDGSAWSAMGLGLANNPVYAFIVDPDGFLVAGGDFRYADGKPSSRLAKWDGATWSNMTDQNTNSNIDTLRYYDGSLIAGGSFTVAGNVSANYIAELSADAWTALGAGMSGTIFTHVLCLLVVNSTVAL